MKGRILVFMMVSVILALIVSTLPSSDSSPEEEYPDADYIISFSEGKNLISVKTIVEGEVHWVTRTCQSGSDVTLDNLSEAPDTIKVVMDGAIINNLVLFNIDDVASLKSMRDVDFTMVKGEIKTFSLLSVSPEIEEYLGKYYDLLSTPMRSVDITLKEGSIGSFIPTRHMVAIETMEIDMYAGMKIDRLYVSGENGRYSSIGFTMNGASVGYMANVSSKILSLNYRIASGSIDYFCIGADTQRHTDTTLSSMSTSFVTGDVSVVIGENVTVKNCILGGGILNIPSLLCNGESMKDVIAHSITIDAPCIDVSIDTAFLTDERDMSYQFGKYVIGGNPSTADLVEVCTYEATKVHLYGDSGIWASISSSEIQSGISFSIDTRLSIKSDSSLSVMHGGIINNAGTIRAIGDLASSGGLNNNGLILVWPDSTLKGSVTGNGYIADYIEVPEASSLLEVSTERDAVYFDNPYLSEIMLIIIDISDKYTIVVTPTETGLSSDHWMISLTKIKFPSEFNTAFKLEAFGIEEETLKGTTFRINVVSDPAKCAAACIYDKDSGEYKVLSKVEYKSSLVISASLNTDYFIQFYDSGDPHLPSFDEGLSYIDYFLILVIVIVFTTTVILLIKMKRD